MSAINLKQDLTTDIVLSFAETNFGEAKEIRGNAIAAFEKLGLPTSRTEEYRFTPIAKYLEKNLVWENKVAPSNISSIDEFLIPGLDANVLVFINGYYSPEFSKITSPASQLTVKTLGDAFQSESANMDHYFDKVLEAESDPFAAINSAFWQEGLYIEIPNKTTVEKPIVILHIHDTSHSQVIAHTRLLLIVGKGSEVTLVEKFDSIGSNVVFHTYTEEIVVAENSQLNYCKIQNDKGKTCQVDNTTIRQADASKINTFTLTLDGELIRNNFNISIDGLNCESHFHGLYLLKAYNLVDNHTVVDHKKPTSYSNELYKGIMDEHSKGVFNGKIYVRPHAQKTNAFQSNRNILVSDTASINTKPQLEIWADDVKCSHGCTTGQLDEEALFYLQSRGISKQSAQAMLLYAFAAEVIEPIQNNVIKDYFDWLISERLQKNF